MADEPSKNVYYVALSCAQKAIRRGLIDRAVNWAKVAWKCDKNAMYRRMWTWYFEDCGANIEAAELLYKFRGGASDFAGMIPIIRSMASGPKNKDVPCVAHLIRGNMVPPAAVFAALRESQPLLAEIARKWWTYGFYGFDTLTFDYPWVVDFAERASKFVQDKYSVGFPYLWSKEGPGFAIVEDELISTPMLKDIPAPGLDGHTRPGQSAFSILLKNRSHDLIANVGEMKEVVFYNEGWLCKTLERCNFNFVELWHDLAGQNRLRSMDRKAWLLEHYEALNNIRLWTMKKLFPADFEMLEKMYHE